MTKFKNLVAMVLSVAMLLALIYVPATPVSAAADADLAGLTPYGGTPYTTVRTLGLDMENVTLSVIGLTNIDGVYGTDELTKDQAEAVMFQVKNSTVAGLPTEPFKGEAELISGEDYYATTEIDISDVTEYGYAMVTAYLPTTVADQENPSIDFTLVFNPANPANITAKNINVEFVLNGATPSTVDITVPQVKGGAFDNVSATYPNALSVLYVAEQMTNPVVSAVRASVDYLTSATINGTPYTQDYDAGHYWTYEVQDDAGHPIAASEDVGAGALMLKDNYKVIWTFH